MAYFRSFFKLKQNFMYREVVLNEVNMIYHKKFELKITLNFKNISMCYTEMKPLCHGCIHNICIQWKVYSLHFFLIIICNTTYSGLILQFFWLVNRLPPMLPRVVLTFLTLTSSLITTFRRIPRRTSTALVERLVQGNPAKPLRLFLNTTSNFINELNTWYEL